MRGPELFGERLALQQLAALGTVVYRIVVLQQRAENRRAVSKIAVRMHLKSAFFMFFDEWVHGMRHALYFCCR